MMNSGYPPHMAWSQWQAPAMAPPGAYWPQWGYPYHPAWGTGPGMSAAPPPAQGTLLTNPRFIRGALIGAAAVYLLSNENVQHAAIRSLVRVRSLVQGGVEEMKERFRDAEAELHAAQAHDGG